MSSNQLICKSHKKNCSSCKRENDECWYCYNELLEPDSDYKKLRNACERLYSETKSYLDKSFCSKFSCDVPARMFEMFVCRFLLSQPTCHSVLNGEISKKIGGPDFLFTNNEGNEIFVEAAVCNYSTTHKDTLYKDCSIDEHGTESGWVNPDAKQLRITGLIRDKFNQREKWLTSMTDDPRKRKFGETPFIIAIAPAMKLIEAALMEDSEFLGTVCPVGDPCIYVDSSGHVSKSGYAYKRYLTKEKKKGKVVKIGDIFFSTQEEYKSISAILFSRINYTTFGLEYRGKNLLDSFMLVHNPYASHPLLEGQLSARVLNMRQAAT